MPRAKLITHPILVATTALCAAAMPLAAARAGQLTPIQTLKQQRSAVLNAKSVDELMAYIPAEQRGMIQKMSAQQKQAALADWQKSLGSAPSYQERVEGDRAAVLIEQPGRASGAKIEKMSLEEGKWVTRGESQVMLLVPGARGSFAIDGGAQASADDVQVSETAMNGRPVVMIRDALQDALNETQHPASVTLAVDQCLAPGTVDLGARDMGGMTVGSQAAVPQGGGEPRTFGTDPEGTLTVTRVQAGRFDGTFQLTAHDEDGDAVKVTGSIANATVPCDQ